MPSVVYRITALLCHVLKSVPVGTNLGLFHLLWTLLSGRLLASRGAVIPALWDTGLPADTVRRAWAALSYGCWQCKELLCAWQQAVEAQGRWQAHSHHPGGTRLSASRWRFGGLLPSPAAGLPHEALFVGSRVPA